MILPQLIAHHLRHGDDRQFYAMQAKDAIEWMGTHGIDFSLGPRVLDLGCGHGVFGASLKQAGCVVSFADISCQLNSDLEGEPFLAIDLDQGDLSGLGQYPLIVCSNVFEHLARPRHFIENIAHALEPEGMLYLSWTNWLSPWGGHDFSPFHYLGPNWGPRSFDRLIGKQRIHEPFKTLYPTYIGQTLSWIERQEGLKVIHCVPRYYPELSWITRLPILREFLTWNTAMLIQRTN